MKVISYSLFGYNRERYENCFDFNSYLRGLWINVRLAKVLYPSWKICVNVDKQTHEGLINFFKDIEDFGIMVYVNEPSQLCEMMLWRMKPIFIDGVTHIICRDADSPLTYREALMVNEWLDSGKTVHAITDSISHNIPLMGGMIGFTQYFKDKFPSYEGLISGYNFTQKGSDQTMLNERVYPHFAHHGTESIIQHYILGMPNTFLSGYRNKIEKKSIDGVDEIFTQTNDICGHIGAAGWYEPPMVKFLNGYDHNKNNYKEFEKKYQDIFWWAKINN